MTLVEYDEPVAISSAGAALSNNTQLHGDTALDQVGSAADSASTLFDAEMAMLWGVMSDYSRLSSEYGGRGDGSGIAMLDTGVLPQLQSVWFEHYEAGLDMVSDASISLDGDGRDSDPSDMYDSDIRQDH